MLKSVFVFLKNPIYQEDENIDFNYRYKVLVQILLYAFLISYALGFLNHRLDSAFDLDIGKHASEEYLRGSPGLLFLMAVILAPILEELCFRGPLSFFKKSHFFPYVFYVFTLIFAFYHILNFEFTTTTLWLSSLLVAPQFCVGLFLGYLRVRFGLLWSIALHAAYNLIVIGPFILFKFLDLPIE